MLKNGITECSVCHSKLSSPSTKTVSRAYGNHRSKLSKKHRALNVLLVVGDCALVGLQLFLMSSSDSSPYPIWTMYTSSLTDLPAPTIISVPPTMPNATGQPQPLQNDRCYEIDTCSSRTGSPARCYVANIMPYSTMPHDYVEICFFCQKISNALHFYTCVYCKPSYADPACVCPSPIPTMPGWICDRCFFT